jgi:hypothetical protein
LVSHTVLALCETTVFIMMLKTINDGELHIFCYEKILTLSANSTATMRQRIVSVVDLILKSACNVKLRLLSTTSN